MSQHESRNPHEPSNDQNIVSEAPFKESHTRSVLKAFSWRIVATSTTILVALFWTGNLDQALAIGGIEFFAKMPVYYLHERGWQLVPRGAIRKIHDRRQR